MRMINFSLLFAFALALTGCNDSGSASSIDGGPAITVLYGSDPLADVEVRLHASPTGPVISQAISASDGVAHFANPPSPEPDAYFVSLASHGDGGWMLDSKYLKPAKTGMKLEPLAINDSQKIELPKGAVRPLAPNRRR